MQATTRVIDTADGAMELYEVLPQGEAVGAIIVLQEAFGVNEHIQAVTRRFGEAGYVAVAPSLFHRAGGGTAEYTDFPRVMQLFDGLTDDGVLVDIDAALMHLESLGFTAGQVGVVGFCIGGRMAFLASARRQLGAGVGFYPGGLVEAGPLPFPALLDEADSLQTPWLGLFGAEDASIPQDQVDRLRATLAPVDGVQHDVEMFDGAGHAFHCDARPDLYRAEAAARAWDRAITWLATHLK